MEGEVMPVVIDNGSSLIKAGFAGDEVPKTVTPTLVGHRRYETLSSGMPQRDIYIGPEAQVKRGILSLTHPIKRGIVNDWDLMEEIWNYVSSNELRAAPEKQPLLISEALHNPKSNREIMSQIMFEKFGVPACFISIEPILALYASGRGTGVVLNSGDGVTQIVQVYQTATFRHAATRMHLAGGGLIEYLQRKLSERGYFLSSSAERETVRDMKEKLCEVRPAQQQHMQNDRHQYGDNLPKSYQLPDGQEINLEDECFCVPEALFDPSLIGSQIKGLHDAVFDSIMKCDVHVRRDLFSNIILAGGGTTIPGFPDRLQREMDIMTPPSIKVKVITPSERKTLAWIGGSIFASLSTFQKILIPKQEYEEVGSSIVHRYYF